MFCTVSYLRMPPFLSSSLRYDTTGMGSPNGETPARMIYDHSARLKKAQAAILEQRKTGPLGWLDLPFDAAMGRRVTNMVTATKKFETLLVLGIGGSDLGARAILQALPVASHKSQVTRRVLFAGANTDPDELEGILKTINWKKTVVNIISKSGDTVEPMSAFLIARERLKKAVGPKFASQIVATTDASGGTLRAWAEKEGYRLLVVPRNVGGRFSVFSDVALFPAAFAGIPIHELLAGAADQIRSFEKEPLEMQIAAQYASLHNEWYLRYRHSAFVLMPYAARLELVGKWYRQLIAESLGKARNRRGVLVETGPTPIAALGATDQHSQIQLYMEGPRDKVVTFIEIEQFASKLRVGKLPAMSSSLQHLENRPLQDLIHAERRATADALTSQRRPNGTLFLPKLDAYHLGALMQMFMLATAYLGEFMDVNAYDQPGVEEGKRRFREWIELRKPEDAA